MKNQQIAKITPLYTDTLRQQLKQKVTQYGEFSFEDEKWYCSLKHKDNQRKYAYTLYFNKIAPKYQEIVKYYALLKRASISAINKNIIYINFFLNYFEKHFPGLELKDINKKIIASYESFLREKKSPYMCRIAYNAIQDFFKTMSEFPEFPAIPTKNKNPFPQIKENNDHKYIPKEVYKQWDAVMKNEELDIPLEFRTAYWLLRSFPNRGTEVLSLKIDCLKSFYSYYVLNVPTWKQNGGYLVEEIKAIPIIYGGHGEYVVSLIKRLQEQTKERLKKYPVAEEYYSKYLFLSFGFSFTKDENGKLKTNIPTHYNKKLYALNGEKMNREFRKLARILKIKDKNGNIYAPTTHQFRHNAVTDRRYLGGYTTEQTMVLTGHKNKNMVQKYTHPLKDIQKEILTKNLTQPEKAPVAFKTQIMNLDEKTIKRLNQNPQAYLTWEAGGKKGVGMCSYIQGCNPSGGTAVLFECYACNWFVPNANYYEAYKKELEYWENVMKETADNPKRAASFENAIRNVSLLERIIEICENGIEQYKEKIIEKIKKGEMDEPESEKNTTANT
ncbi:tyrosine-type recombinase/integrase [Paenibacillus naphthalenovorans]|uniref:Integrase n=1 Tax=Paenibacillus naphthalenovorans TaxID=162209 RepID=A0A0U2M5Q3_9BACL|nr:tyrosine-type recombinase/integrase [Paenibacillus naphthalenovorans]ALS23184.1 integrase [Paenibacillus naphthalenovorans]